MIVLCGENIHVADNILLLLLLLMLMTMLNNNDDDDVFLYLKRTNTTQK